MPCLFFAPQATANTVHINQKGMRLCFQLASKELKKLHIYRCIQFLCDSVFDTEDAICSVKMNTILLEKKSILYTKQQ